MRADRPSTPEKEGGSGCRGRRWQTYNPKGIVMPGSPGSWWSRRVHDSRRERWGTSTIPWEMCGAVPKASGFPQRVVAE